ncbi:MAG: radical SAM protein [Candidatus Lokiarchaeota archaeon]|nr:radical SAM protein [Candidatus Lokiarchaeota archaeon]
MLTQLHLLLTYTCNYECDHCFLYCNPSSKGTFTLKQIRHILDEAFKIKTIEWIYFEGGEPFLYYPLLVEGVKLARDYGFKVGIVTNSYWATNEEDAELWLHNIAKSGVTAMEISNDDFHFVDDDRNLPIIAQKVAEKLRIPSISTITIDKPEIDLHSKEAKNKGSAIMKGGAVFRGRAVEKLIFGLPTRPWETLNECPYEDLEGLGRVHLDSFGNVQICQGLSIGNFLETPLNEIIRDYDPRKHPICGPLLEGGPAQLVRQYHLDHESEYVDECHLCYLMRKSLIDKFPKFLTPRQVYGLE